MPRKTQDCTKAHLLSVALPTHADTYTVISHEFVINYSYQALAAAGFTVVDEEYRCNGDGQIAQGIYRLNYNSDPELSMMFAWTNSYNKQVKFRCGIGAYINKTGTVMTSGDIGTWVRKHMGTADTDTKKTIDSQVQNAHMYYDQLVADKASMENIILNKRRQAQMLGILFGEYDIISTEQASIVKQLMNKPTFSFTNTDSLWQFYNYVTIALQESHPKTWMEDQRILHYFITSVITSHKPAVVAPIEEPVAIDPLYAIPNQTNILDEIKEVEAGIVVTEIEPDDFVIEEVNTVEGEEEEITTTVYEDKTEEVEIVAIEEPVVNEVVEAVHYTDAAGNTFETPSYEVAEDPFALDDDLSLNDINSFEENKEDIPDFF